MSFHPYNPNSSRTKRERFNWSSFMDQNSAEGGLSNNIGITSSSTNSQTLQQHSDASSSTNSHATKSSPRDNQQSRKLDETFAKPFIERSFDTPIMSTTSNLAAQHQHHSPTVNLPTPTLPTQTNIFNSPFTIQGTMPINISNKKSQQEEAAEEHLRQKSTMKFREFPMNSQQQQQQHGKTDMEINKIRLPSIFEWWHEDGPSVNASSPLSAVPFSFPPNTFDKSQLSTFSHSPPPQLVSYPFVPIQSNHEQHANNHTSMTFRKKRHSPDSHAAITQDFTQIVTQQHSPPSSSPPHNNLQFSKNISHQNHQNQHQHRNVNNFNNINNNNGNGRSNQIITSNMPISNPALKKRKTSKPNNSSTSGSSSSIVIGSGGGVTSSNSITSAATTTATTGSSINPSSAQQQKDSFLLQNEYEQFNKGEHEMQKKGRGEKIFKYSYYQYNNTSSNK